MKANIGKATLYLGNCLDVLDEIDTPGSLITDPPYGIGYKSGYRTELLWQGQSAIAGDECTSIRDRVIAWVDGLPSLVFGTWKAIRPPGTKQVLIWDKGGALGMGNLSIPWKPDHEEIYVLGSGFVGRRDRGSVLRFPPVQSTAKNGRLHPTEKPVELMRELCRKSPGPIFDPFMGSGSTGVAALQLGLEFIGVELVPEFFDIACRRIEHAHHQGVQIQMFPDQPKSEQVSLCLTP